MFSPLAFTLCAPSTPVRGGSPSQVYIPASSGSPTKPFVSFHWSKYIQLTFLHTNHFPLHIPTYRLIFYEMRFSITTLIAILPLASVSVADTDEMPSKADETSWPLYTGHLGCSSSRTSRLRCLLSHSESNQCVSSAIMIASIDHQSAC